MISLSIGTHPEFLEEYGMKKVVIVLGRIGVTV